MDSAMRNSPATIKFNITETPSSEASMKLVAALNLSSFGLFQMRYPDKKLRDNDGDDAIMMWELHENDKGGIHYDMTMIWSIPKLQNIGAMAWIRDAE